MRRSRTYFFFSRTAYLLGGISAVIAMGYYARLISNLDAFSNFRSSKAPPNVDASLNNLRIESFDNGKLTMRADVDQVTVSQNRQVYDITGVTNGYLRAKTGEFRFDAPTARWNVPGKFLDANLGGHIVNADMDVRAPQFAFNANTSMINIPGQMVGKLKGGEIVADATAYNVSNGDFEIGMAKWKGPLALQDQQEELQTWEIRGRFSGKGNIQTVKDGVATDGSIIIMADVMVHDKVTDLLTATGNVRYFSAKANLICEKAVVERKIKKATLTGKVQMLVKAKDKQVLSTADGSPKYRPVAPEEIAKKKGSPGQTPEQKKLDDELRSSDTLKAYPTICYSDKIVYWYKKGERRAEITGNPQARQELAGTRWRHIWTKKAFYDGEKETLRMESTEGKMDTRMINSIGDDFVTEYLITSTVDGSSDYEAGNSHGYTSNLPDEDIPKQDKGSTPPPTTTGGGGGRFRRA